MINCICRPENNPVGRTRRALPPTRRMRSTCYAQHDFTRTIFGRAWTRQLLLCTGERSRGRSTLLDGRSWRGLNRWILKAAKRVNKPAYEMSVVARKEENGIDWNACKASSAGYSVVQGRFLGHLVRRRWDETSGSPRFPIDTLLLFMARKRAADGRATSGDFTIGKRYGRRARLSFPCRLKCAHQLHPPPRSVRTAQIELVAPFNTVSVWKPPV